MKASIIHNPVAGQHTASDEIELVAAYLAEQGWDIARIAETAGPGCATAHARRAVSDGCDVVFSVGGDGTLAQVVDGLVGTETGLAVLPGGTGNVMARQLNLPVPGGLHPHPVLESARLAVEGQTRWVDVGRITPGLGEPRHFLCWSGVGFDAQVNQVMSQDKEIKRRLGLVAFVIAGVKTLRDYVGTSAIVRVDGHRVSRRILLLVANNIQIYGVVFRMASRAVLDDGCLDVYCFQGRHKAHVVVHVLRTLLRLHIQDPQVDIFRARRIEIETARPLAVHVDGDWVGETPAVIEVLPRALKLLVPNCAPASLFVDGSGMLPEETAWEWVVRWAKDAQVAIRERSNPRK
jgi:diacylglycerol kinase (ATP)